MPKRGRAFAFVYKVGLLGRQPSYHLGLHVADGLAQLALHGAPEPLADPLVALRAPLVVLVGDKGRLLNAAVGQVPQQRLQRGERRRHVGQARGGLGGLGPSVELVDHGLVLQKRDLRLCASALKSAALGYKDARGDCSTEIKSKHDS